MLHVPRGPTTDHIAAAGVGKGAHVALLLVIPRRCRDDRRSWHFLVIEFRLNVEQGVRTLGSWDACVDSPLSVALLRFCCSSSSWHGRASWYYIPPDISDHVVSTSKCIRQRRSYHDFIFTRFSMVVRKLSILKLGKYNSVAQGFEFSGINGDSWVGVPPGNCQLLLSQSDCTEAGRNRFESIATSFMETAGPGMRIFKQMPPMDLDGNKRLPEPLPHQCLHPWCPEEVTSGNTAGGCLTRA